MFFRSIMDVRPVWYLSAHKLSLPAGMTYEDGSPYSVQRGENGVERGVGYIQACFTEDTVHFHINNVVRGPILRDFLAGSEVLPAPCHDFLQCALPRQARLIANRLPG